MTDNSDDVDPEDPRPRGHYPRFEGNEWHYVTDELAQTISLGPATDGKPGDDWVLTYTPERRDESDREKVLVRLTPRALHELHIETKTCLPTRAKPVTRRNAGFVVIRSRLIRPGPTTAIAPVIPTVMPTPSVLRPGTTADLLSTQGARAHGG